MITSLSISHPFKKIQELFKIYCKGNCLNALFSVVEVGPPPFGVELRNRPTRKDEWWLLLLQKWTRCCNTQITARHNNMLACSVLMLLLAEMCFLLPPKDECLLWDSKKKVCTESASAGMTTERRERRRRIGAWMGNISFKFKFYLGTQNEIVPSEEGIQMCFPGWFYTRRNAFL